MMEDIEPKIQYIIGPNGFLINVPVPQFNGHFYKHGEEEKVKPILDAIADYNKQMHRDIKWKELEF